MAAEGASEIETLQTPANSQPTPNVGPRSRDLLMPVMNVETSVAFDLDGKPLPPAAVSPSRAGPTFNSRAVIYTAADARPKPPPAIRPPTAKYGSHETLPTTRPKPRLTRAHSEQVDGDGEPKPAAGANRWGVLQAKTVGAQQTRKDKRRAQIVAAVTRRLFSVKKKSEEAAPAEPVEASAEAAEEEEPEELKICARARASLKAMVSRRRRAEVETQTDFALRTIRLKEVAVETDDAVCRYDRTNTRKSVATQCSRVAEVVDEVYRRWWHHYGNGAAWQRWPNAVFVTQHRFVAGEDEFSDDSLDSNHDAEGKVAEGDRPCVWKVLTIASGQHFARVDGAKADLKVAARSAPRIIARDEIKSASGDGDNLQTSETEPLAVAKACSCQDSIGAMQAAIECLQQSLREQSNKPESSCFIKLCDGGCPAKTVEHRSKATQTTIATACVATQCQAGQNNSKLEKACSCALCRSHQKIKSFVYRWKNKCRELDEVDVKFAVPAQSQYCGGDGGESGSVKSRPELRISGSDTKPGETATIQSSPANQFPINFIEVPFSGSKTSRTQAAFKPSSQALSDELLNNNNNNKCSEAHPDRKCAAVQQCYFPVMMNNNGRTSVMGFVKDQDHQTFFLPVLASNSLQVSKPATDLESNLELLTGNCEFDNDSTDLFREDSEVSLPRSFPELAGIKSASEAIDGIIKQRIDAEKQHWLEIKNIILGHEYNATPSTTDDRESGGRKTAVAKKRVTWRDYQGCGNLVEVRSVPPRDEPGLRFPCDNKRQSDWDKSRLENVLNHGNVSNNNVPNINITFYPFVETKLRCDQHYRNCRSRIYLLDSKLDERPKLFKRFFKTFDHNWEIPTSQKGKIMNMFHSRSKYYEEKLAQLSVLQERRRKSKVSGSVGEKTDQSYSDLMSYVNNSEPTLKNFATGGSTKSFASNESERAGWNINVNVAGNCVQINQEKPFQIQSALNCLSDIGNYECELCTCVRRTSGDIGERVYFASPDRNRVQGCKELAFVPHSCEINKRSESNNRFGSANGPDVTKSESSLKSIALPSKYMRHLLAVRRQIVSTLRD